jgi:maltodextrin utilization protein YvdJ
MLKYVDEMFCGLYVYMYYYVFILFLFLISSVLIPVAEKN